MEDNEVRYYKSIFPYPSLNLDDGKKYLGFHLKPNKYMKKDWMWLISKMENRINVWCHKWLSRAGRLVLVKLVLEAIPIY